MSREVSTLLRKRRILSAPCHRRQHILWLHGAAGERWPPSLRPGGRALMAVMDVDTCWISFIFIFSLLLGSISICLAQLSFLLVRLTPPFLFWRGLVESGLDSSVFFFWLCGPFGRLVLRWGGSVTDHQYFLLLNQTYVLSNVRPELFIVVLVSVSVLFFTTDIHTFIYFTLFLKGFFI